ncbi:MAG: LrgB family protein [Solobacterium sp.]|nr:LrgB family protein [Solobacterium sp.]
MNNVMLTSATIGVVISLIGFFIGILCREKFKLPIFNPLLIAIIFTIGFVSIFRIDYDSYYSSAKYLSWLLTPATVALAVPLYKEIDKLKANWKMILISIACGCISSVVTVLVLSLVFRFNHAQYVTFLPKSITTAIGMGVAEELGGIVPVTVAAIIVTGIFGAIIADIVFKIFHITDPIAQGLALGASAHAIGTSKAIELGDLQGAMAGLAICTSGIITVALATTFAGII